MKKLKVTASPNSRAIASFINDNNIKKEDILTIVQRENNLVLFYYED